MKLTRLQQLAEGKKTHDECSDEIDAYHAEAMASLKELKKIIGKDVSLKTQQEHLMDAISHLTKAISLAKDWNKQCG